MIVSANAGNEADQTVITIMAVATGHVTGNQTLDVRVVLGGGITAGDFVLSNTTITILSGQSMGSVTFTVQDDNIGEFVETARVEFSNPSSGITLGPVTHQNIVITDNDSRFFDFDKTSSGTSPGYTSVLGSSVYSAATGFGWIGSGVESFATAPGSASELLQDYHFIRTGSKTFRADLPNGEYNVRVGIGSTIHKFANEAVYINGVLVDVVTSNLGVFLNPVYLVTVTDGKLEVAVERQGGTIVGINELSITRSNGIPVIVTSPTTLGYVTYDPLDSCGSRFDGQRFRQYQSGWRHGQYYGRLCDRGRRSAVHKSEWHHGELCGGHRRSDIDRYVVCGELPGGTPQCGRISTRPARRCCQTRTVTFEVNDGTNTASATRKIEVINPSFQTSSNYDFNKAADANAARIYVGPGHIRYNSSIGYGWTGSGHRRVLTRVAGVRPTYNETINSSAVVHARSGRTCQTVLTM